MTQHKNHNNNYKICINNIIKFALTCLLFFSFSSLASYSSEQRIKIESITEEQGLSQNIVYSIAQDDSGFVWFATQDGLDRYDGQDHNHYKNTLEDEHSLANNIVRVLYFDSTNTLWVGTQNGLSKYDPKTDSFVNYFHLSNNPKSLKDNTIWTITEDNNNNLWVATSSGLQKYNRDKDNFTRVHFKDYENQIVEIKSIYQDDHQNYWLGTFENGAYLLNEDLSFISPLNGQNKWHLDIDSPTIFDIKKIDGQIWLASNNGIFIVNDDYQLAQQLNFNDSNSGTNNLAIRSMLQVNDQYIWFGTEAGLFELNLADGSVLTKSIYSNFNEEYHSLFIYSLFKDSSQSIWLGSRNNGVKRFNSTSSLFFQHLKDKGITQNQVVSFAELPSGTIWTVTASHGLYYQLARSENLLKSKYDYDLDLVTAHPVNNDTLLLVTSDYELYEYHIESNELIHHPNWMKNIEKKSSSFYYSFLNDTIWFGSDKNILHKYSLKNKTHTEHLLQNTFQGSLSTISFNNKKQLWVHTNNNNLFLFDTYNESFKKVAIPEHPAFSDNSLLIIEESNDYIWFAFTGQGILLLDKSNNQYTEFNEATGLSNNFSNALLLDDLGNAWISNNKGLGKINPITKQIINYGTDHGIMTSEFITKSSLINRDGKMYFGSVNGFNAFYPRDIDLDTEIVTKPIYTNLLVENKKLLVNKNRQPNDLTSLPSNLNSLSTVTLGYQQSPFAIEFISPNSTFSNEVLYRYQLEGIDQNWIYTSADNRRATYTKLPHGEYNFKLEAINNKNNQFHSAKPLSVKILPPWWFSNIAWLVYAGIVLLIIYYFINQAKVKVRHNLAIKQSEERLKLALWGSGDEMWDWNMQTNQMYRSNIWGILDFQNDASRAIDDNEDDHNIHPQDYERVKQLLEDHKLNKTEHYEAAYRVKNKEGVWIWVLDRGKVVERDKDDAPVRMTGTLKDISKIKHTEESLKLFAKCIENISDAVVVYEKDFTIVDCNSSFERITGQTKAESLGQALSFNSYPESFLQNLKKNLIHHGSWQGEVESRRTNGSGYLIDITLDIIRDENKEISHYVGVFSDITKRKETEAELRKLANSDTLTGLPNRSYYQANQSQLVAQDVEHALLVFDLDNFKKINDSLGHQIGDILLCKVTERIATVGNIKDTCYRLGGDEFSLIIEGDNDIHKVTSIADEILNTIAEPYFIQNQEIALTCSIGIALYPDDGSNSHELLKNADTAMYHAKDKGGDTYQYFNDSMNKQAVKRLQIENLIRHGLKEDLFSVYYQPKINVKTGSICGMEALVRFEAGNKGIIRPDIFIPISEETGQIIEIGEIVLRKACIATKAWIDNGIFEGRIAVNLSAVQFRQPNLVQVINEILEDTQLPPKYLELEITEGTVMDSPREAIETMNQIRRLGIALSLDDFGTGYSSLAYLKEFPLNTLKIDKAFVDDIEQSEEGRNMVATIVTIAHNLGMNVVAEGVETEKQLAYLRTLDCEQLQGYLYSRPLSDEDFGNYLLSHIITKESTPYTSTED